MSKFYGWNNINGDLVVEDDVTIGGDLLVNGTTTEMLAESLFGALTMGDATNPGGDFTIKRNNLNANQIVVDADAAQSATALTLYGKAQAYGLVAEAGGVASTGAISSTLADADALVLGGAAAEGGDIKVYSDGAGAVSLTFDGDGGRLNLGSATNQIGLLYIYRANGVSFNLGDATHEGGDIAIYEDASGNKAFSLDADAASMTLGAAATELGDFRIYGKNGAVLELGDTTHEGGDLVIYQDAAGTKTFEVDADAGLVTLNKAYIDITRTGASLGVLVAKVTGDAATRFSLNTDGSMEWGSGTGAKDTNLYRETANSLRTDDTFRALLIQGYHATPTTIFFQTGKAGDTYNSFDFDHYGKMRWGPGTGVVDVVLERSTAGTLRLTTGALDFNNNPVSNVGAAGNDFGATNSLVATTFSGAVALTRLSSTKPAAAYTTTASDNLKNSNDTERTTTALAYTKIKETVLGEVIPGMRIKFDLKTANILGVAYAKLYKNGVAVGTEQTDVTAGYVTKSEDLTGFVAGDLLQIYAYTSNASYAAYVQNLRLYYDFAIDTTALSATNQDP